MREMKDSGIDWIGEIPSDWGTTPFRAYVIERTERNKLNKTDELLALSYALGVTLYKDKVYNKDRVKNNFEEYNIVHKNDLVLSPNDIIKGSIFVSQYYGCISPMYNIFAPRNEKTHNLYYLSYLLRTKEAGLRFFYIARGLIGSILDNGKYVTRRMTVSHQDLLSFKVLLPPYKEQERIVSFLDTKCSEIDALSADIQSEIDTLQEYKRSVITEAVTKGLDKNAPMKDSGTDWLGDIPKHWDTKRGKYVFVQKNDKGNSKSLVLLSPTQNYGVIPQDLYEELSGFSAVKLNEKIDFNSLKTVHKGAFVISLRSFQGGFEYSEYEGVVSPAYQVFYPSVPVYDTYYKYLFKTQVFIDKMNSYTMSLRDGKNIAFADFGRTYIPIPPVREQEEIAIRLDNICSELNTIIKEKQEQLEALADYKKSLIYEYVTGKKEVPAV